MTTTSAKHYADHLAPIYAWMAGGIPAALEQGKADIAPFLAAEDRPMLAIDLGAGFGMHSIPIAKAGYVVTAIDSSSALLQELQKHAIGLPIRVVEDDLVFFRNHVTSQADLIVCMGDTLTHLSRLDEVNGLLEAVAHCLRHDGKFVATFRDYTVPPPPLGRFIPVRSDENRILTCFLEYSEAHVMVHDLIHEKSNDGWHLRVSAYPKLRLSPADAASTLQRLGLKVVLDRGPRGMVLLVATRQ